MRHAADRVTAILDANVLYPFLVRDVLLSLAEAGLYRARWTQRICDEWTSHLIKARPGKERLILNTVALMNRAFPEAMVERYQDSIPSLVLPDADDRHRGARRGGAAAGRRAPSRPCP